ncbi:efflux RND transporter periplasmic adaptor subunit [Myxococcota bacterium]|nr:efflux RND transporter periplasmic adaptor subunit [Myxococcota bacterium]
MNKALKVILPLLLLAAGAGGAQILMKMKPKAKLKPPQIEGALVTVAQLEATTRPIVVRAHGVVIAARRLEVQPEISGRINRLSEHLVPGGRVSADEVLVEIERRDYDLAASQAKAQVAQSELNLEVERGRAAIAKREWAMLGAKAQGDAAARARALREPQASNALAALEGAKAALAKARLNAKRTRVTAPFNALVLSESAEIGQIATPGRAFAQLVGTDAFWVQASLPTSELPFIQLNGGEARVEAKRGAQVITRRGRVLRLLGELEPQSRMAQIIIEVEDPLGLKSDEPPLLLNDFVEVELRHQTRHAVALPRAALREGDRAWVMSPQDTLVLKDLKIARRERDVVLVEAGIEPSERVILSRLGTALPGMKLRLPSAANAKPEAKPEAKR